MNPDEIRVELQQKLCGLRRLRQSAWVEKDIDFFDSVLDVLAVRDQELQAARHNEGLCHFSLQEALTNLEAERAALAVRDQQLEDARELVGWLALRFEQALGSVSIRDATECLAAARAFLAAGLDVQT